MMGRETISSITRREHRNMKKIMSLMLGLSLVLGTAAFAEDKKVDDKAAVAADKADKKAAKGKKAAKKADEKTAVTADKPAK